MFLSTTLHALSSPLDRWRAKAWLVACLWLTVSVGSAAAQNTAFTYQGRLMEGAQPAEGYYDFQFRLADAPDSWHYLAGPLTNLSVAVHGGVFTTPLDFGPGMFDGSPRWLELAVRTNGSSNGYTVLSPRQPITPAPFALTAQTAAGAAIASNLVAGSSITVNGAGITNLNGANIQAGSITPNQLASQSIDFAQLSSGLSNQVAASGRAVQLVTPQQFGAKGDGVSDDSGAFQAAASALANTGGLLFVPRGTYRLTRTIVIGSAHTVVSGEGEATRLLASGDYGHVLDFHLTPDPATYPLNEGVGVRDLTIESDTVRTQGSAIYGRLVFRMRIDGVHIGHMVQEGDPQTIYDGISWDGQCESVISHTTINHSHYGVYVNGYEIAYGAILSFGAYDGLLTGNFNIWGPYLAANDNCESVGVYLDDHTGGFQLEQGNISWEGKAGIYVNGRNNRELMANAFFLDSCNGSGIQVHGALARLLMRDSWAAACGTGGCGSGGGVYVEDGGSILDVLMTGNYMYYNRHAVDLANVYSVILVGNSMIASGQGCDVNLRGGVGPVLFNGNRVFSLCNLGGSPITAGANLGYGGGSYSAVSNAAPALAPAPATNLLTAAFPTRITRSGSFKLAPSIVRQPVSVSAPVGASAQFTVTAKGSPAVSYRWQVAPDSKGPFTDLQADGNYSGVNLSTLTIQAVAPSNAAYYQVIVVNTNGTATSTPAQLTLQP